jgi:hypothetical protein
MSMAKTSRLSEQSSELSDRLVRELESPKSGLEEPIFIEDAIPLSDRFRVYVIWNEWNGIWQRDRSRVILEAYARARGETTRARISHAMGLTAAEAERLGVQYEPIEQ